LSKGEGELSPCNSSPQIGDTDITGAVCGSLAGACYGLGEIPSRWQQSLTGWFETIELAERIHELAQV